MNASSDLQHAFSRVLESVGARLVSGPYITGNSFECLVDVGPEDSPWGLRIVGPWPFTTLPTAYLTDLRQAAGLAHVNFKGDVCYSDHEGEGFSAAESDAPLMLANVVLRCRETLQASTAMQQRGDFSDLKDEFEGFWGSLPQCKPVLMECEPLPGTQLYARIHRDKGELTLRGIDAGSSVASGAERIRVKVLVLGETVLPPEPGSAWEKGWLDRLLVLGEQSGLKLRTPGPHVLLCRQRRPSGGESLFGVFYRAVLQSGNLIALKHIRPFIVSRCWPAYLMNRVGGSVVRERVAVVGCGSLGGRIAEQLALAGVEDLILIDPDKFSSDNIFRHVLGRSSVGAYKAQALADEIHAKRPGIKVTPFPKDALTWLQSSGGRESCATIVLATGNLALEREIVRLSYEQAWPQRIISGWIEPLGLGGHAIASCSNQPGCLECLHQDHGETRPAPKTQFLTPGQDFSQNLTGCGGAFTPYSALAATRTALMVSEMVLSHTTGYRCWIGSDQQVRESGMTTTYWYQQCVSRREDGVGLDISDGRCPCCGT